MVRRMMNAGITRGWSVWVDTWRAKTSALAKLRACGNRLRAPEATQFFDFWRLDVLHLKAAREAKAAHEREVLAAQARMDLLSQLDRMKADYERRLAASEAERMTLHAKLLVLDGGQSQMEAMLEAQVRLWALMIPLMITSDDHL